MSPHPLLALLVAKKAMASVFYIAGRQYGFPRLYRRILELNKQWTPVHSQAAVRKALAAALRSPTEVCGAGSVPALMYMLIA